MLKMANSKYHTKSIGDRVLCLRITSYIIQADQAYENLTDYRYINELYICNMVQKMAIALGGLATPLGTYVRCQYGHSDGANGPGEERLSVISKDISHIFHFLFVFIPYL